MTIKQTCRTFLDFIFPMREDAKVVSMLLNGCFAHTVVPKTHKSITWLFPFQDQRIRACVHEVKFHQNQKAALLLAEALGAYIQSLPYDDVILIPVPLSKERRRTRGYNQIECITSCIKNCVIENSILVRNRDTEPQTSLTKDKRLKNVANAFRIQDMERAGKKIHGKNIILLDDVFTTGATLTAAKAPLSSLAPASITCLALAH